MKKRILFVDDEVNILRGLQRMLRTMRNQWDMTFATSGREALDILDQEPFDVVISDMRMPGMDGAEFLQEVMQRHSQMVRIVLSGHAEREMVLKSVKVAHQYLAKPCDARTVISTVERACALQEMLTDDRLKRVISKVDSLPSLPSLYTEIVQELRSDNASIGRVGEIISKDIGMTAKILQLVNSAFFGLSRHVSSPAQAVNLLGIETVKTLVLAVQVFSRFDEKKLAGFSLDALWSHSMSVGTFAKTVVRERKEEQSMADHAFVAGVLHDVGKLILAANSDKYGQFVKNAHESGVAVWRAEQSVLGITHAEVGAYLLGIWGLPNPVIEAVAFHHLPQCSMCDHFNALTAVHVADAIENELNDTDEPDPGDRMDLSYLAEIGLADAVPGWRIVCENSLERD